MGSLSEFEDEDEVLLVPYSVITVTNIAVDEDEDELVFIFARVEDDSTEHALDLPSIRVVMYRISPHTLG